MILSPYMWNLRREPFMYGDICVQSLFNKKYQDFCDKNISVLPLAFLLYR